MRSRRFSFFAGWAAVALTAAAGFAAFGNPNPTSQEIRVEAAGASMGHTSGAYAGLAFAVLGPAGPDSPTIDVPEAFLDPSPTDFATAAADESTQEAAESAQDNSTAGWLSEVEVRAFVTLYFEPADVNRAVRVAWCESRFNPDSVNRRTGGIGLFQHLPRYWEERASNAGFQGVDATDAEASTAAAAWAVYNGGGWDVFTCRG
ncbi:MAG: transglycosylase SLT domain-containing protein [Actinomycetota bacterium]|nr:transglycosylase SLT domain-containing protein [Actinomycetota bacterium]